MSSLMLGMGECGIGGQKGMIIAGQAKCKPSMPRRINN
jgi:hypothetical protein